MYNVYEIHAEEISGTLLCVEIDLILERDVNRGVWMKGIRLIRLGEGISLPHSLPTWSVAVTGSETPIGIRNSHFKRPSLRGLPNRHSLGRNIYNTSINTTYEQGPFLLIQWWPPYCNKLKLFFTVTHLKKYRWDLFFLGERPWERGYYWLWLGLGFRGIPSFLEEKNIEYVLMEAHSNTSLNVLTLARVELLIYL